VLFEWVFGGDLCPVLSFLLLLLLKDFFLIHSPLVEEAGGGGLNQEINFHQKKNHHNCSKPSADK